MKCGWKWDCRKLSHSMSVMAGCVRVISYACTRWDFDFGECLNAYRIYMENHIGEWLCAKRCLQKEEKENVTPFRWWYRCRQWTIMRIDAVVSNGYQSHYYILRSVICNISLKFETTGTLNTGVLWCKLKVLMKIPKYLLKMHFIQLLLSSSFIHWFLQTISLAAVDVHHGHYGLYLLEIQGIFPAVDSLQLHAKLHPNKLQFT